MMSCREKKPLRVRILGRSQKLGRLACSACHRHSDRPPSSRPRSMLPSSGDRTNHWQSQSGGNVGRTKRLQIEMVEMVLAMLAMTGCVDHTPSQAEGVGRTAQALAPSSLLQMSIALPNGSTLPNVFMSATHGLSIMSQARAGAPPGTPVVANFGASASHLQAEARLYGELRSVADVELDAKTLISGSVITSGVIRKQGVGTADAPVIQGKEITGAEVDFTAVERPVAWPDSNRGDV